MQLASQAPIRRPRRLRENLGNAERRHWLHAKRRNRDHASDIEQQKHSLIEGQNGEESGREGTRFRVPEGAATS